MRRSSAPEVVVFNWLCIISSVELLQEEVEERDQLVRNCASALIDIIAVVEQRKITAVGMT